jgi:hypothetical protein
MAKSILGPRVTDATSSDSRRSPARPPPDPRPRSRYVGVVAISSLLVMTSCALRLATMPEASGDSSGCYRRPPPQKPRRNRRAEHSDDHPPAATRARPRPPWRTAGDVAMGETGKLRADTICTRAMPFVMGTHPNRSELQDSRFSSLVLTERDSTDQLKCPAGTSPVFLGATTRFHRWPPPRPRLHPTRHRFV